MGRFTYKIILWNFFRRSQCINTNIIFVYPPRPRRKQMSCPKHDMTNSKLDILNFKPLSDPRSAVQYAVFWPTYLCQWLRIRRALDWLMWLCERGFDVCVVCPLTRFHDKRKAIILAGDASSTVIWDPLRFLGLREIWRIRFFCSAEDLSYSRYCLKLIFLV